MTCIPQQKFQGKGKRKEGEPIHLKRFNRHINKDSRGDGIPVELFQILKDDAVKMLHSICQQTWHTQPRARKDLFAFQSQRKAMPKNAQTTAQLHSFHMLVK